MIQRLRKKLEYKKGQRDRTQQSIDRLEDEISFGKRMSHRQKALEIVKQVRLTSQKQLEYHLRSRSAWRWKQCSMILIT